jgi:ATP-dependent DNA helicase DinG
MNPLPPFWATQDREVALESLRRIDAAAPEVLPVVDSRERSGDSGSGPTTAAVPSEGSSTPPAPRSVRAAVRGGRGWTPEEDAGLRTAVGMGHDLPSIAKRYDCSPEQIADRLVDLGLTLTASDQLLPLSEA